LDSFCHLIDDNIIFSTPVVKTFLEELMNILFHPWDQPIKKEFTSEVIDKLEIVFKKWLQKALSL